MSGRGGSKAKQQSASNTDKTKKLEQKIKELEKHVKELDIKVESTERRAVRLHVQNVALRKNFNWEEIKESFGCTPDFQRQLYEDAIYKVQKEIADDESQGGTSTEKNEKVSTEKTSKGNDQEIQRLKRENVLLEKQMKEASEEVQRLKDAVKKLEGELESDQEIINQKSEKIATLNIEVKKLKTATATSVERAEEEMEGKINALLRRNSKLEHRVEEQSHTDSESPRLHENEEELEKRNKELDRRLKTLHEEKNKLEEDVKHYTSEIEEYKRRLENAIQERDSANEDIANMQDMHDNKTKAVRNSKKNMFRTVNEMQKENDQLQLDLETAQGELENMRQELGKKETELKELRQETREESEQIALGRTGTDVSNDSGMQEQNEKLKEDVRISNEKLQNLRKELEESRAELEKLKTETGTIREKTKGNDEQQAEMNSSKEELKTVKRDLEKSEAELKRIKPELEKSKNIESQLKEAKRKIAELQSHQKLQKEGNTSELMKKIRELEEENDNVRNRMSKMAGAKLLNDNPNIADLSDENRPTKLGEKYSELYDNEWTDAFEEQTEVCEQSEEGGIKVLLTALMKVHDFCQKLSKEYLSSLTTAVGQLPGYSGAIKEGDLSVEKVKQIKDMRKSMAGPMIENVCNLCKDAVTKELEKEGHKLGESSKKYIQKCVELSWMMSVQDPPVVIDHADQKAGMPYDADLFKHYTRTGDKLEYVVWPPLFLKKDGPMLSKGVAQAKKK